MQNGVVFVSVDDIQAERTLFCTLHRNSYYSLTSFDESYIFTPEITRYQGNVTR